MLRAIQMGTEGHALFLDGPQRGQAEYLKAAAVRQDGLVPGVETVQTAPGGNEFIARAQIKMIGIAEDDFRPDGVQVVGGNGLDAAHRAYRHEDGRVDRSVGRLQRAGAGRLRSSREYERFRVRSSPHSSGKEIF